MVVIFYISVFLLAVVGIGFWLTTKMRRRSTPLPQQHTAYLPPGRALFANDEAAAEFAAAEALRLADEARAALLSRARNGDVSVLAEVQADAQLYRAALDALTEQATDDAALQGLVQALLPQTDAATSQSLVQAVITRADAFAFSDVLRVAALSGDAASYQQAIETVLKNWQAGKPPRLTAAQLSQSIESEYWLLSSEARASGAGFLLKQKLIAVRRELAAVAQ
jgi:hypothetical protein